MKEINPNGLQTARRNTKHWPPDRGVNIVEITIKGKAEEIATLVLAVQGRREVINPPNDNRESMIQALENRLSKLKRLP